MRIMEGHEESVIIQPMRMVCAEFPVIGVRTKAFVGAPEKVDFVAGDGGKVDLVERKCPRRLKCPGAEEIILNEKIRADEQRIAGERRIALIGRVGPAWRIQRQHLPKRLAAAGQEIDEAPGFRTEITDAVRTGQRSWVQKNAAGSLKFHDDGNG